MMKNTTNLDEAYLIYEERYNLTKLAEESGIDMEKFKNFSSKEKFFTLAYKLKDTEHFHLASFFFNKLFEILQSMEALLNKIDCLIILGEFEEAFRFNCLGFELFLEMEESSSMDDIEKTLAYQKAIILFSSSRFIETCTICENNIIKFCQKTFFPLLCAALIARKNTDAAIRIFERFHACSPYNFLAEVSILLLSINQSTLCTNFLSIISGEKLKKSQTSIESTLKNIYKTSKNKISLENFLKEEIDNFKTSEDQIKYENALDNCYSATKVSAPVITKTILTTQNTVENLKFPLGNLQIKTAEEKLSLTKEPTD